MTSISGSMPIAVTINNSHMPVDPKEVKGGLGATGTVAVTINNSHRTAGPGAGAPGLGDQFEKPKMNFFTDFAGGAGVVQRGASATSEELEGGPVSTGGDNDLIETEQEAEASATGRAIAELVGGMNDASFGARTGGPAATPPTGGTLFPQAPGRMEIMRAGSGAMAAEPGLSAEIELARQEAGGAGTTAAEEGSSQEEQDPMNQVTPGAGGLSADRRDGPGAGGGRVPIPQPGSAGPSSTPFGGDANAIPKTGLSAGFGSPEFMQQIMQQLLIERTDPERTGGQAGPLPAPSGTPSGGDVDPMPQASLSAGFGSSDQSQTVVLQTLLDCMSNRGAGPDGSRGTMGQGAPQAAPGVSPSGTPGVSNTMPLPVDDRRI